MSMRNSKRFSAMAELIPIWFWLGALTLYYTFVTSVGTFESLSWHTDYYDLLAQGFREGHLYVPVKPSARLLAKSNPYDFKYWRQWLWDASLYEGRYYLYWGPVPGLCLLAFKTLTRWKDTIYDQWLVLAFMLGRLYAGAALIVSFARSQGVKIPSWAVQLAVLVFGLSIPSPYFMARPLVYEASIAAGQCFLFLGLYAAYQGILRPRVQLRCFVLAGTCFSLAFGSRGSLLVVAPLLTVGIALVAARPAGYPLRALIASGLALGTPVALGVLSYALYNKLRFDSYTEFGLKYQLTSRPFGTDDRFFLPNVVSYLTSKLKWDCEFPFVSLPMKRTLTHVISWPEDYDTGDWDKGERSAGLIWAMRVSFLWAVWLVRGVILSARRIARTRHSVHGMPMALSQRELFLVTCAGACACALLPASRMWMANMRFLQDAAGGILLGAVGAAFWLVRKRALRARPLSRLQRAVGGLLFAGMSLHTIVVGVLLGFSGHMNNFEEENPELFKRLKEQWSMCSMQEEEASPLRQRDFPVAWRDAQR
jgi:hypothetical protein